MLTSQDTPTRSPVNHHAHTPVVTGAVPSAITVASAAPVRDTEYRKAAWYRQVDSAHTSKGTQAERAARTRSLSRSRAVSAPSTTPPTSIRQPPRATVPSGLSAMTWAGPTVPHRTAAPSTSPAPAAVPFFCTFMGRYARQTSG